MHSAYHSLQIFCSLGRSKPLSEELSLGHQDMGDLVFSERGRHRHRRDMVKGLQSSRHLVVKEMYACLQEVGMQIDSKSWIPLDVGEDLLALQFSKALW